MTIYGTPESDAAIAEFVEQHRMEQQMILGAISDAVEELFDINCPPETAVKFHNILTHHGWHIRRF